MKKTHLILLALAALLIWFQITRPYFINKIRPRIIDLAKFPLKAVTKPVAGLYNLAAFQDRYEKNILLLEKKVALLMKSSVGTQEILEENRRLRALLSFKSRISSRTIAAEVIARSPSPLDSFIIIDKGSADGIIPDMAVAKETGLVGRVFETGENTSKVMLLDNPNSKVGVLIQRTRDQGTLIGLGGGFCKIIYLAYETETKPGDIVIASEFSNISPKGILIGEVVRVLKGDNSLYASAIVRPSVNLFRIEEVLCIE